MDKAFIPYAEALELKKLGFDEPCFGCYDEKGVFGLTVMSIKQYYTNSKEDTWNCSALLYQQAFRWFRDKYNLIAVITTTPAFDTMYSSKYKSDIHYKFQPFKWVDGKYEIDETYEEAELACLRKLIEIVKNEQT